MDARSEELPTPALREPLLILSLTEVGPSGDGGFNAQPYLKSAKSIKFMAKQDCLALCAAALTIKEAGLTPEELNSATGVYLTVGTLPFEEVHLNTLAENSVVEGRFDMKRFSTEGYNAMSPMLTFKCLPNMPLFHISFNLGIHGPYCVTYPGPSQFFTALDQAIADLYSGRVKFAVLGAVADQLNFLVRHSVRRGGVRPVESLVDAACVMVLTLQKRSGAKGRLTGFSHTYSPVDPLSVSYPAPAKHFESYSGPVEPLLAIRRALESSVSRLSFSYEDGVQAILALEAL